MEASLVHKIDEYVEKRKEEAISLLRDLINYQSLVGTSYVEIQKYIEENLLSMKLDVDRWCPDIQELRAKEWWTVPESYYPNGFDDKPLVVGTLKGLGNGRSIIFNGHVEVVTPDPLDLWHHDPWAGEIENGKLFGRGAIDCKGGLAAAILAIKYLQQIGVEIAGDVILQSVYDEEIGGTGTYAAILRGYRADGSVIVEPSNHLIQIAHAGVMWMRVSIEGKSAHAAFLWEGINAVEKAMKIHNALSAFGHRRMAEVRHPLFEENYPIHATFNTGTFSGGGYPSSVPDKAILEYRVGTIPGEDNEEIFNAIKKIVDKVSHEDEWLSEHPPIVELFGWYGKPVEIEKDHPLTQSVSNAYQDITNENSKYTGITACCDIWRLHHLAHSPSLVFGPNGDGIHQNDEYIMIDDFITLIKIYACTILNWCGHN